MIFRTDDADLFVDRKGQHELAALAQRIIAGNVIPAQQPVYLADCRLKDNHDWILTTWLPGKWVDWKTEQCGKNVAADLWIRNSNALMILLEAYTARVVDAEFGESWSYEQHRCDGSTGVPDSQMPCGVWCKDPASVAHDYIFDLHHAGEADATGKHWTLEEANEAYRDILLSDGQRIMAHVRFAGLQVFGRLLW